MKVYKFLPYIEVNNYDILCLDFFNFALGTKSKFTIFNQYRTLLIART